MKKEISDLITSGKKITLARLEIDGEPKRLGHGELTFDDQTIVLTMIGNKGASVDPGEDLKIKVETEDGEILIITGSPHKVARRLYPQITMNVNVVLGRKSGKDPDEKTNDPSESFVTNVDVEQLVATNGAATITEDRPAISSHTSDTKMDHLVVEPDRIHVLEKNGLQITYIPRQVVSSDAWVPITTAVAYVHGALSWPYYLEVQTRGDATFTLRNSFNLPTTVLRPISRLLADSNPDAVINVVKSISGLIATHRFKDEIHDILHNFIIGTAGDAVPGTLVAAAALEGLCRLLEGKIDARSPSAKQIIESTAARLRLGQNTVVLGLKSWERVRDTLAHGIFQRAHQSLVPPRKPARPANENIVHDLSRISGLFHATILKEAKYCGPFALSILEEKGSPLFSVGNSIG